MRIHFFIFCIGVLLHLPNVDASSSGALDYSFQFSLERSALDGLSLGDDPAEDRLLEEDFELEINLEYQINDNTYLFFVGAFIDETETIETSGRHDDISGLERKELGLGYFFGNSIQSELNIGRMEFSSRSDWFLWWDEELDGVRLKSTFGDFESIIGLTEEQARESTGVDFIDPEMKSVKRMFFTLDWEIVADHSVLIYYLDQSDNSRTFNVGEFEKFDHIDEEDADLSWNGISYFGEFDHETIGNLAIQLHSARVKGNETVYEFDDPNPASGLSEVAEREKNRVSGTAQSYLFNWTPAILENWTLILGNARGSGDNNPDDNRIRSYRQTGLQGDSESYGELYQPELSNLVIDVIGISWMVREGVAISILNYNYQQRNLADEMRDVSIEPDLSGSSRDLGRETDLIVSIEADNGIEFILSVAEFEPGKAYGSSAAETSNYINIELAFEF